MKKAYSFTLTVEPKNLEEVQKLLDNNKELFLRTLWNKVEVKIL